MDYNILRIKNRLLSRIIKVDYGYKTKCWEYTMSITGKSYAYMRVIFPDRSEESRASRVSWRVNNNGKNIPRLLFVLHHCDNRRCVRYSHLFLGTHQDNMDDMISKGRSNKVGKKGSSQWNAKLTNQKVLRIRKLYSSGNYTQRELGIKFNVTKNTIGSVVRNKSWTHI